VILNKFIKLSKKGMRLTIIMTTAASTIEVLVSTLNLKTVKSLISVFIGGNSGFLWVNFVTMFSGLMTEKHPPFPDRTALTMFLCQHGKML